MRANWFQVTLWIITFFSLFMVNTLEMTPDNLWETVLFTVGNTLLCTVLIFLVYMTRKYVPKVNLIKNIRCGLICCRNCCPVTLLSPFFLQLASVLPSPSSSVLFSSSLQKTWIEKMWPIPLMDSTTIQLSGQNPSPLKLYFLLNLFVTAVLTSICSTPG